MNKKTLIITGALVVGVTTIFTLFNSKKPNEVIKNTEVIEVVDGQGKKSVPLKPKGVVVFDYGVLDALDNMEVEVLGLPKGNVPSSLSKYNDEKYKDLGDLKEPDFEAVSSLKPELIIIGGRQKELYDKFNKIAPTIYLNIDGAKYMEDLSRNLKLLGKIFDKEDYIENKLGNFEEKIKEINDTISNKNLTASTVMVNEGNLSAFSDKSRFGLIYNQFGFINIDSKLEASSHGNQVSFEYLNEKNPDYIFVIDRGAATGESESAKALFNNELIKNTKAYKENKIIYLDSEVWYLISGGISSTEAMLNVNLS